MKQFSIANLSIEVTRRCNLTCKHCMRGDSQDIDLDIKHVKTLFKKVKEIGQLVLTGGEPSLAPDIILQIAQLILDNNINVFEFYIATNGQYISNKFINSVNYLCCACIDVKECELQFSNDSFHKPIDPELENKLKNLLLCKVSKRQYKSSSEKNWLLGMGRTQNFMEESIDLEQEYYCENQFVHYGFVYINVLGEIIGSGDLSYERQNDYKICDVKDLSLGILQRYGRKAFRKHSTNLFELKGENNERI